MRDRIKLLFVVALCLFLAVLGETDPSDFAILDEFRKGLDNPELLEWPSNKDPCGPPLWPHVFCTGSRVSQIQVQGLGLIGPLPQNFNQLSMLYNLGLQKNNFTGKLPSFNGLSKLQYAYLDNNEFDTIPSDFFVGLTSLQVLSLDYNPLNQSTGWVLPQELQNSAQLANLSLMGSNLVGPLPDFLGRMSSLTALKLSYNTLSGEIPESFAGLVMLILWLNNQGGTGLTGSINVIASMLSLTEVWLHGNGFTGSIPNAIGACTSLTSLWLNNNQLVGLIPENLTAIQTLQSLKLDNNKLMGPIPKVRFGNFTYSHNSFCQSTPGVPCSPEVSSLLDVLGSVNYPLNLATSWSGNDPCTGLWLGVSCSKGKVSVINLPNFKLNGSISPSIGKLDSLVDIILGGNNLNGTIPADLTSLKSLRMLNLSSNNLGPPVPKFSSSVKLHIEGNPLLDSSVPSGNSSSSPNDGGMKKCSIKCKVLVAVIPIATIAAVSSVTIIYVQCFWKGENNDLATPNSIVVRRDSSAPTNLVRCSSGTREAQVIEEGNKLLSVESLRAVTGGFHPDNVLGRGGFGVVYKGRFNDGRMIAVKRMEPPLISNKALDQFHAEIHVLTKVRHRNLVSLLNYSVEGNERILVYEYMPKGDLSKHLFRWEQLKMEPLTWETRFNIALDVARGMEHLHSFAHENLIHRDLKSSNILLGGDYQAKVSDFGLVKVAPEGKDSMSTKVAGTFGYIAPEYVVSRRVTKMVDVFSFGVVLMELVTGRKAIDNNLPNEMSYLAGWFRDLFDSDLKSSEKKLMSFIDKSSNVTEETLKNIFTMAELARHCADEDPKQRPDMGHAVYVLRSLVVKWKPKNDDQVGCSRIGQRRSLPEMVDRWKARDGTDVSSVDLDDSKRSLPARSQIPSFQEMAGE